MTIANTQSTKYQKALLMATKAHEGQKRASGEPYIVHPKAVAEILQSVYAGPDSLVAALLHDTLEDTDITFEDIEKEFGENIAKLVEGVTKLDKVEKELDFSDRNLRSIRKMFRAIGKDLRIVFIKLADRLHNLRTIKHLRPEKQQRIALETQDIFCPLANLLGIRSWYHELSDLALEILEPHDFSLIQKRKKLITDKDFDRLRDWKEHVQNSIEQLGHTDISVELRARRAHSIHKSIQGQSLLLDFIETFYRLVVTTKDTDACYSILGAIHQATSAIPGHIQDYISQPKINGYRALHTTVMSGLGNPIKVLIQSEDMVRDAEFGATMPYQNLEENEHKWKHLPPWLDKLLSLENSSTDAPEFFQSIQTEIFGELCRVHIAGDKKQLIDLPANSSVLDVAFYTDDDTGKYAVSGIVNKKHVSLKYIIHMNDVVEIVTNNNKVQREPHDVFFTHTSLGKRCLIEDLSQVTLEESEQRGRQLLNETINMLTDPFFSTVWRKSLAEHIPHDTEVLHNIGIGIFNPFDHIANHADPSDFFMLNRMCFLVGSQKIPNTKTRFVLRTSPEKLLTCDIIGRHVRPDVIDVYCVDDIEQSTEKRQTKELVPLAIRNPALFAHPFRFAMKVSFRTEANSLEMIAGLQSMLDTPITLIEITTSSAMLSFLTRDIQTLGIVYEHLAGLPDITSIVRTSS